MRGGGAVVEQAFVAVRAALQCMVNAHREFLSGTAPASTVAIG
jgi:hypothetical protein